jgi:hypothetical protein
MFLLGILWLWNRTCGALKNTYPEDAIVFRHTEPNALRKVCTGLRWKIISDGSGADDKTLAVF